MDIGFRGLTIGFRFIWETTNTTPHTNVWYSYSILGTDNNTAYLRVLLHNNHYTICRNMLLEQKYKTTNHGYTLHDHKTSASNNIHDRLAVCNERV